MLRLLVNKARHHYNTALEHAERGRNSEAIAELNNALDLDNNFFQARVVLGTLYTRTDDMVRAKETWESLFELDPAIAKAYAYLQKAETVVKERPIRRWLRGFVATSAVLGVLLIGFFVWNLLPARGYSDLVKVNAALEARDYQAGYEILTKLEEQKSSLSSEIAMGVDLGKELIDASARETLEAMLEEVKEGNWEQLSQKITNARRIKWPASTLATIETFEQQLDEGIQRKMELKVDEVINSSDDELIKESQREIARLSGLSESEVVKEKAETEITALQTRLEQNFEAKLRDIQTADADLMSRLLEIRQMVQSDNLDGAKAAKQSLRNQYRNLEVANKQLDALMPLVLGAFAAESDQLTGSELAAILDIEIPEFAARSSNPETGAAASPVAVAVVSSQENQLESWFNLHAQDLLRANVSTSLLKLAKINSADLLQQAPESAPAVYSQILVAGASGDWDSARQLTNQLREVAPGYKPAEDLERFFPN
jgi:tetratricopeptide (TPR) repeat protein